MSDQNSVPFGLTAIVPCFNEVSCIGTCYRTIAAELDRYENTEILFIDDGSTDGTLEQIKDFALRDERVRYISFTRNFGLEAAFGAGFRYASKSWTVQLDADLQSPPAELHKLLDRALQGFDVVFAIRMNRADSWIRRLGTRAHHAIATRILGIELPIGASVFRVARTSVARKVVESKYSTPYFLATVPLMGARYDVVPTAHSPRQEGAGKWRLHRLFSHAVELFVGFSFRPLAWFYLLAAALGPLLIVLLGALPLWGRDSFAVAWLGALVGSLALLQGAVVARYLVRMMRVQASASPRFQVREANIEISADDHLYGYEFMESHRTLER